MHPFLKSRKVAEFQHMSPRDMEALLASARTLQRAARSGATPALLRGRHIGLMTDTADNDEARLFTRAAAELGARVSHIVPTLPDSAAEDDICRTAGMLGRLYDAVECQGTAHDLAGRLAEAASVPVFEGISSAHHPTARLADLLDDESSPTERRKFVLQALLVGTIP